MVLKSTKIKECELYNKPSEKTDNLDIR